jgi:hypothetical protein
VLSLAEPWKPWIRKEPRYTVPVRNRTRVRSLNGSGVSADDADVPADGVSDADRGGEGPEAG